MAAKFFGLTSVLFAGEASSSGKGLGRDGVLEVYV